jgi:hypothetical protein
MSCLQRLDSSLRCYIRDIISDRSEVVKRSPQRNSDLICLPQIYYTPISFLRVSSVDLEVKSTNPFVDDVKHGLVEDSSGSDKGDDSNHSETSVDDLGFLGESGLEGGQVSERLRVALDHLVVIGVVWVQKERVSERKWADGGHQRDSEEMGVSDEDDGTLVADGFLSRDGGKSSPLLKVEKHAGIRDESVTLGISRGANEHPTEHGVAAVPLLGLDGRSPSPLGKRRELSLPVLLRGIINRRVDDVQRAGLHKQNMVRYLIFLLGNLIPWSTHLESLRVQHFSRRRNAYQGYVDWRIHGPQLGHKNPQNGIKVKSTNPTLTWWSFGLQKAC